MGRIRIALTIMTAVFLAACTLHKQEAPPLTGPSTLGTNITVTVSPDTLSQDGASQSLVTITARDANGQPLRNVTLRTEIAVSGVLADFGTLSARTVVTDANGHATVVFTAPPPPAGPAPTTNVDILVTPLGTDFGNATPQSATIRLVPAGVVAPPRGTVTASFTVTPASPTDHEPAQFDGSATTSTTGTIVSWAWNFGDGTTANGQTVQHAFTTPGNFSVTLTATDSIGASNFITKSVAVGQGTLPTPVFTISPTPPASVGQTVNFDASQSRAAPGHTVRSFDWNFGDGARASGVQVSHAFSVEGTYVVVLTVTDDAGRTAFASQNVTVGNPNSGPVPKAAFTFSPINPVAGDTIHFNASSSTAPAGRRIVTYSWDFGDGSQQSTGNALIDHVYSVANNYRVTLIVTDDAGNRSAPFPQTVSVGTTDPIAQFTFAPTNPVVAPGETTASVTFDATASTAFPGRTIVSYQWNFGDGTTGSGQLTSHPFGKGTFTVSLTVTDNAGQTSRTFQSVIVN